MGVAPHALLSAAVEAARAALRDLDADQVPNDLRRACGASGTLPPPLAKSVLRGLEQYEWLREQAAGHLDDDGTTRAEAASLYLRRPAGWELALADLAARAGADAGRAARRSAAGKEAELAAALKAAREKARSLQRESAAQVAALERKVADLAAERRAEVAGEARIEQEARRAVEAAQREAAAAGRQLAEARDELRRLQQDLKDERTRRRKEAAAAAETAGAEGWMEDPAGLAERLDHTAVMARPAARRGDVPAPAALDALRLPSRVAPDGRGAVEWLLGTGATASVLIDGYNLGYLMGGERAPAPARARVGAVAHRLHTMGGGSLRVMVVYDSDEGPEEAQLSPGPVAVRFSRAGEIADDVIVRLVGEIGGRVVVVSNDREVRERSEAAGALALWSSALAAWAGSR